MRKFTTPFVFICVMLLSNIACFAGKQYKRCSSAEVLQRQLMADPSMRVRMDEIERFTRDFVANSSTHRNAVNDGSNLVSTTITIPVVVHVLYNTSVQNVSDAMVQTQIEVLNKDFSATNSDKSNVPSVFASLVANTNIQFCLAKKDPSGLATTGIVRKSTSVTAFIDDDKVKNSSLGGDNAWNASKYLNLWVCNLGNGLLGYAQFPGGAAATDGVVVLYSSLPGGSSAPYDKGRSATHEIGHWLNLRHTWGDANCGDDLVLDTPTSQTSNFGCPSFPSVTCNNGPNGDLFQDYMDYTDDECMFMFTNGQSARMNALFATGGTRTSIATSDGCSAPSANCGTPTGLNAGSITSSSATLNWTAVSGATSYNIQYKKSTTTIWTTVTSTTNSKALSGLTAGTVYNYQVQAVCSVIGSYSSPSTFTTSAATIGCGIPSELSAGSITSTSSTLSWTIVSGAKSYNIQYKKSTATYWSTTNSSTNSKSLSGLTASTAYNFKVQAVCTYSGTYSGASTFTTSAATTSSSDPYEANNSFSAAASIPVNSEIKAMINSASDIDWFKFTNSSASANLKLTLSNLPNDYDLELYNSSNTFLISSDNAGTSTETIVFNSAPTGTYYIRVIGYGGVSSSSCYTFKAETSNSTLREVAPIESKSAFKKGENIAIFPNPSPGIFNINYLSEENKRVIITIYDLSGKIVKKEILDANEGENHKKINMQDADNGLYIIGINEGNISTMYKIMIHK